MQHFCCSPNPKYFCKCLFLDGGGWVHVTFIRFFSVSIYVFAYASVALYPCYFGQGSIAAFGKKLQCNSLQLIKFIVTLLTSPSAVHKNKK